MSTILTTSTRDTGLKLERSISGLVNFHTVGGDVEGGWWDRFSVFSSTT